MRHTSYLLAALAAFLVVSCSDNPVNPKAQSGSDEAAITGSLTAAPEFLNDGLFETSTTTNLAPSRRGALAAPGAAGTAIDPFHFWRSITHRSTLFEFAFSDSDSTGHPTTAVVTLRRTLTGSFNIAPRDPSNPTQPDPSLVIHKPLEDRWVRRFLMKRVSLTPGSRPFWRLAAASGVEVTSKDATTLITSVRVQSASKDTTLTDPMAFIHLRRVLRFATDDTVTVTVTTPRTDDVVLLYAHLRRAPFTNNGDGTYTAKFAAGAFTGFRHFGVNALTRGTLYDDTAAYDSKAWIFPYVLVGGPDVDYWP
ncbi:MAG TPA: hypothetical protein VFU59_03660 [Candidatus Eisenbacteria bacterium]|nr:hypothetical protein [Candidatus Eisenbacteria bacterium]